MEGGGVETNITKFVVGLTFPLSQVLLETLVYRIAEKNVQREKEKNYCNILKTLEDKLCH